MNTAIAIKQGALVTPKEHIKMGRLKASPGQTFWITTATITNQHTIGVARSGRGAGYAVMLSRSDFERYFDAISAL